jgi:hypothetical protein
MLLAALWSRDSVPPHLDISAMLQASEKLQEKLAVLEASW